MSGSLSPGERALWEDIMPLPDSAISMAASVAGSDVSALDIDD